MPTDEDQLSVPDLYFHYLYSRVYPIRDMNSMYSYTVVCRRMHATPFKSSVPYDDNRSVEANDLRHWFLRAAGPFLDEDITQLMKEPVSVLEVLIYLAVKLNSLVELGTDQWFRIFVDNLGLAKWNDVYCQPRRPEPIKRIIERFNDRTYKANGEGGLFPLKHPEKHRVQDQRVAELWYQAGFWMTEHNMA